MKKISFIALVLVSGNLLAAYGDSQMQNQNYQVDIQQQTQHQQMQQQPTQQYRNGQIVSSNEPKIGNPAILKEIQELLKNSHKNYVVTVHVADDVVTLSGSVNSDQDKRQLEDKVRAIQGVKGVKNELTVNPGQDASQTAKPSYGNFNNSGR